MCDFRHTFFVTCLLAFRGLLAISLPYKSFINNQKLIKMKRLLILTLVLAFLSSGAQNKKEEPSAQQKTTGRSETIIKKRILIIVSNANAIGPNNRRTGTFLPEVAHPYAEFEKANYQVDFASLTGDTPYLDALNLANDPQNLAFLTGKGWEAMQKASRLSGTDVTGYDAIFVPGGLAPMVDMLENTLLKKIIKETYERNAVVGAVCHGPVSLLNVKLSNGSYLVSGKNITSFTDEEEKGYAIADVPFLLETALTKQGAKFHAAAKWTAHSIADGNLVTGQNPASAKGVAEKMISILEAKN